MDERDEGQSHLMTSRACNPKWGYSVQRRGGHGTTNGGGGGCICKQIIEQGCPSLTSHGADKSLCSLLFDFWTRESSRTTFIRWVNVVEKLLTSDFGLGMSSQEHQVNYGVQIFIKIWRQIWRTTYSSDMIQFNQLNFYWSDVSLFPVIFKNTCEK